MIRVSHPDIIAPSCHLITRLQILGHRFNRNLAATTLENFTGNYWSHPVHWTEVPSVALVPIHAPVRQNMLRIIAASRSHCDSLGAIYEYHRVFTLKYASLANATIPLISRLLLICSVMEKQEIGEKLW